MTPFDLSPHLDASDREGLERLKTKTDEFIQEVFDWSSPLRSPILQQLYDFKSRIDTALEVLTATQGDKR